MHGIEFQTACISVSSTCLSQNTYCQLLVRAGIFIHTAGIILVSLKSIRPNSYSHIHVPPEQQCKVTFSYVHFAQKQILNVFKAEMTFTKYASILYLDLNLLLLQHYTNNLLTK